MGNKSNVLNKKSKDRYSTIDLEAMDKDNRLSFKEAGILYYLLTRPDDWEFNKTDLVNRKDDGRTAITNGLNKLKELGYLKIEPVQEDDSGQFNGYIWHVTPDPEELPLDNSENTDTETQVSRDPVSNTHNNKTKETINNTNNKDSKESLPEGFKEQQGYIIKKLSPYVDNEGKLWGLVGKWINAYGFNKIREVIRQLDNKGKLDMDGNLVGYIVSILESNKEESDSKEKRWENLIDQQLNDSGG